VAAIIGEFVSMVALTQDEVRSSDAGQLRVMNISDDDADGSPCIASSSVKTFSSTIQRRFVPIGRPLKTLGGIPPRMRRCEQSRPRRWNVRYGLIAYRILEIRSAAVPPIPRGPAREVHSVDGND
jgi:hypothetical protein